MNEWASKKWFQVTRALWDLVFVSGFCPHEFERLDLLICEGVAQEQASPAQILVQLDVEASVLMDCGALVLSIRGSTSLRVGAQQVR